MVKTNSIPPPEKIVRVYRLNDTMRSLMPGESMLLPDSKAAQCLREHARFMGWEVRQRKEGQGVRVWRVA
jgi:hypothetical protein